MKPTNQHPISDEEPASVLVERLAQHKLMRPLAGMLRKLLEDPTVKILMENDPALLHNKAAENDNRLN